LVEEATIDAYNESEQATGLYTMMEDNLRLPFETEVLGVPVTVVGIHLNDQDEIVAACKRGDKRQQIDLLNLPLPTPPPVGAEWIEAYRHWRRGGE
jgi:CRISPR/Cas system-associated protein Cas7 (RAMP superfamily)